MPAAKVHPTTELKARIDSTVSIPFDGECVNHFDDLPNRACPERSLERQTKARSETRRYISFAACGYTQYNDVSVMAFGLSVIIS